MSHPFFDAASFPWSRPDARALFDVLTWTFTSPQEIALAFQMSGGSRAFLDLGQSPAIIWTQALDLLTAGGLLREFCTQLQGRFEKNKVFQKAVRDVINAAPTVERPVPHSVADSDPPLRSNPAPIHKTSTGGVWTASPGRRHEMPMNVDLVFSKRGRGYGLELTSTEAQAAGRFTMPHTNDEIQAFRGLIHAVFNGGIASHTTGVPPSEAVKAFGGKLFQALIHDTTDDAFRAVEAAASRAAVGLRLRLFLADTPELMNVPWEYLYDRSLNRFLCLSKDTAVVRYLDVPTPTRPLVVPPPLRILVVLAIPAGLPPLDLEREWNGLNESLAEPMSRGQVVLERLTPATITALQRRIRREPPVHVFHFGGHGSFGPAPEGGMVAFESEPLDGSKTGYRGVSGEELAMLLSNGKDIRVAMVNAAEGAVTSAQDPFAGVAQALVANGIPAVVSLQGMISDQGAITLAQEFYSALGEGLPVDTALVEGRRAMRFAEEEYGWGVPVLYLRSPDGNLFDVPGGEGPEPTVEGDHVEAGDLAAAVTVSMGRDPATGEVLADGGGDSRAGRSLVRDVALGEPEAPNILMLSASPRTLRPLRVDDEAREIQAELDRSERGREFRLVLRPALRYADLQFELLKAKPAVLHFSGHGKATGIFVEGPDGEAHVVSGASLTSLLAIPVVRRRLQLVVLNACLSADQAEAIARAIDGMVVGMSNDVTDKAAIEFARGLYGALGDPSVDLQSAFELARNRVEVAGLVSQTQTPQRFIREGIDPRTVFLGST